MVVLRVVFRDKFQPVDDDVETRDKESGTPAQRPGWRGR
jgi:hypothetical protein